MKIACIYVIVLIAFFGASIEGYKLAPPAVNWLTEPLIYLCFILTLITRPSRIRFPLLPIMVLFLLVGGASVIINHRFNLEPAVGMRLIFRYYVLFLALVSMGLNELQIRRINSFLILLFIIQIPVATIKLFIYGQGESAIGTYALHGGALSTMLPLIAIGFLFGFYFYYEEKKSYIFLILGFVFFSIIGGKRAFIFFFLPLVGFSIVMLRKDKNFEIHRLVRLQRRCLLMAPILFLIAGFFALKYLPSLNPERVHGGSVDIGHALNFTVEYNTKQAAWDDRYSSGRIATTRLVFSTIVEKGLDTFCFGYGPGAYITSRFISKKDDVRVFQDMLIGYGMTPMTIIAIEYGVLGVIIYFTFMLSLFFMCIKYWKIERDPYWKAFSFGSLLFAFSMTILWASYNPASLTGDTIPLVFYYCMAVVAIRLNEIRSRKQTA